AIKFTEQGTVRLTARVLDREGVDPVVRLEVRDTGIGMSTEEMIGLFQPYYRVTSSHHNGRRGSGPGLAICRRLANQLGGEVSVHTTPGSGSTSPLTLPLHPATPTKEDSAPRADGPLDAASASHPIVAPPRLSARILLAEDHEANRQL